MLMAPRLIEALVQTLEAEPLLADERAVPGGIWRDVIPQDVGRLPAIVVAFVVGLPNANSATSHHRGARRNAGHQRAAVA
jgi:hypothetical protein